jgi:hypothetical protein
MRLKITVLSVAVLGAMLMPLLCAAPAQAQATRTWVSGVGDDANPCSRTAPCKTFAGAISKTATGGYIDCLDPGGFGAVTITKSITIQCEEETGHVLVSGTNGIVVSLPAGSQVTLRGLSFEGVGAGLNGISFVGLGTLNVQEVVIHDFTQNGINFTPSGSGSALLVVSDETLIFNNGGAGINVTPGAGASTNANLNGVQLSANGNGMIVNGTNAHAGAIVDKSRLISNTGTGLSVSGAQGIAIIGNSTVTGNGTGVSGTVQSLKNNQIAGNTSDGTPITAFPGPGQPLQ